MNPKFRNYAIFGARTWFLAMPTSSFFHYFSKMVAFTFRWMLRTRYRVSMEGIHTIDFSKPILFLPNHQALIDPVILVSHLYRYTTLSPVISEKYHDIPLAKSFFEHMGAVKVSDLESGNRDINVLTSITNSVSEAFQHKKNIVIYPGGQIAAQGYERILNKKSAYYIVHEIPEEVQIIGVRVSGLWGSIWSKAKTGKSPNLFLQLGKGFLYVLANLIFFVPKRSVRIECEEITMAAKEQVNLGQKPFNLFLEEFYNVRGEEKALFLRHFFFLPNHTSER